MIILYIIFSSYIFYVNAFTHNTQISEKKLHFMSMPMLQPNKLIEKTQSFYNLTRANNIFPTTILCFTGGWIMKHKRSFIKNPVFITSLINTNMIMLSSMIINDLFDLDIDKINNKNRPLVSGKITKKEATYSCIIMLLFTEYMTFTYLPLHMQIMIQLAILDIIIYTPLLKPITLLKNISCASLVSFSLYFNGIAANNINMTPMKNIEMLWIATRLIFFGSFVNEIVMDIRDYEGDKLNNIYTIPVRYGLLESWKITYSLLMINMCWNAYKLGKIFKNIYYPMILSSILLQSVMKLYDIRRDNYSRKSIYLFLEKTNMLLVLSLGFLCAIV